MPYTGFNSDDNKCSWESPLPSFYDTTRLLSSSQDDCECLLVAMMHVANPNRIYK